jgi:hypothetical protein
MQAPAAVDGANGRKAAEVAQVLRAKGLIQAVSGAHGGEGLGIFYLAKHHARGVPAHGMKEEKHQGRYAPNDEERPLEALHWAAGKSLKW